MTWITKALQKIELEKGGKTPFVIITIDPTENTWAKIMFTRAEIETKTEAELAAMIELKASQVAHNLVTP